MTDLVVGDILLLEAGDRVPADCLLIEEMDMTVDQKEYFTEEIIPVEKQCSYNGENHLDNPDPTLLQNSLVMNGSGKAVVLAVGKNTLREKELTKQDLQILDTNTPLQIKLGVFGAVLGKWAYLFSFIAFVMLSVFWLCNIMFGKGHMLVSKDSIHGLLDNIQIAIALLIVSVPEGLPLAVAMSMAFSIDKLKQDHLLIKNLSSLETSGSLIDVLTGKTATLTEGDMHVGMFYSGSTKQKAKFPEMNNQLFRSVQDAIVLNTEGRMEMCDQEHKYKPEGSPVEVGMLRFLIENDVPV